MQNYEPNTWYMPEVIRPALPDANIAIYPHFLPAADAERYFKMLREEIQWRQDRVKIFGRWVDQPRLSAWHGQEGASYTYSGLLMHPQPFSPALLALKEQIEKLGPYSFNSVLLNLYRHGQDGMGWHSDDEPELGAQPVIVSLSLGATRRFVLRHRQQKALKYEIAASPGSLIIMQGDTQRHWQHQVPKTAKVCAERINLTYRHINKSAAPLTKGG